MRRGILKTNKTLKSKRKINLKQNRLKGTGPLFQAGSINLSLRPTIIEFYDRVYIYTHQAKNVFFLMQFVQH